MTLNSRPLLGDIGVLAMVPERWSMKWMGRHQVLTRLARYFHVVWVNPAHDRRDILKKLKTQTERHTDSVETPRFTVYTPELWLPRIYRPEWLAKLSLQTRLKRARRMLTRRGCEKIILYIWRPEFASALLCLPFSVTCYHIADEYSFSDIDVPLDESEKRLIERVDQVFITSRGLLEKKGGINPHTTFVPNGVDVKSYATAVPEPVDMASIPHPRIGYTGTMKSTLDWPLLLHLTLQHPEWHFVFVGPQNPSRPEEVTRATRELSTRHNVHFLGFKPPRELAAYPQHFDVCIMPYRPNDYTKYIYPLKLHEYLASGRPTVGTQIRSLEDFADVVALPRTIGEWSVAIKEALSPMASTAECRAARQAVARRHDWDRLVQLIAHTMCDRLGPDYVDRLRQMHHHKFEDLYPPANLPPSDISLSLYK